MSQHDCYYSSLVSSRNNTVNVMTVPINGNMIDVSNVNKENAVILNEPIEFSN